MVVNLLIRGMLSKMKITSTFHSWFQRIIRQIVNRLKGFLFLYSIQCKKENYVHSLQNYGHIIYMTGLEGNIWCDMLLNRCKSIAWTTATFTNMTSLTNFSKSSIAHYDIKTKAIEILIVLLKTFYLKTSSGLRLSSLNFQCRFRILYKLKLPIEYSFVWFRWGELVNIYTWLTVYRLSLDLMKTKYMIFHPIQKDICSLVHAVIMNVIQIEKVHNFHFLGVCLDSNL